MQFLRVGLVFLVAAAAYVSAASSPSKSGHMTYDDVRGSAYNVSYDKRAILINGERTLFQAGSIHYPRATPDMWPSILEQSKAAGLNLIQTYVFWNLHEEQRGVYDFETDIKNLPKFLQACADAGLFVNLRIGPYVCAEWHYGGFPMWLRDIPGMEFRTFNQPWMDEMTRFVKKSLEIAESFLARNGGPIVLLQIENEYGNFQQYYGADGIKYRDWAAELAVSLEQQTPWIMCVQDDAPTSVISTCNGFYCDQWLAGHWKRTPNQPGMWTENWPGWFQNWGEPIPHRPTEDVSFAVARWFAYGGTYMNYYMFFGGTNFGRTSGGPFIVTSYDYDVALSEFGRPSEPKYSHSKKLHEILNEFAPALLTHDPPAPQPLGLFQEAHVYGTVGQPGTLVFLSNIDSNFAANVSFHGQSFYLPAWSVSLVDGATLMTLHNTAIMVDPIPPKPVQVSASPSSISYIEEPANGNFPQAAPVTSSLPLEHLNVTHDETDYLWYLTDVHFTAAQIAAGSANLALFNSHDYFYVYLNGVYQGVVKGVDTSISLRLSPQTSSAKLGILSCTVGIVNFAFRMETYVRGLTGSVLIDGKNITSGSWTHIKGLQGESLDYPSSSSPSWQPDYLTHIHRPLTWFHVSISTPARSDGHPTSDYGWALDMAGMGKGLVWINGHQLGRYWSIIAEGDCSACDYRGTYVPVKCRTGCGEPSQRYYHVPHAWLNPITELNTVVVFEEAGGDPSSIRLINGF